MYPLMIGLVVETKQLWEEIQAILQALPFRIVLEQSEVGDWPTFLSKLERLRPEVLLFDISKSRDSIEEQLQHIRSLASPPVFIAVDSKAEPETILREAIEKIESLPARGAAGLSPHAPYSTAPGLLRLSAATARRVSLCFGVGTVDHAATATGSGVPPVWPAST